MRFVTVTDLMNLTGKSLSDVLKKMGNPDDKEKNGLSINLNYRDKNVIITFEIFAGKVKSSSINYNFFSKANIGVQKFKIRQELLKAGYELENSPSELKGSKGNSKVFTLTSSVNAKNYNLRLISVIEK
jgi:hypothetical protein